MRLIKIFKVQCELSIMSSAIFRVNFFLMLFQSIVNSIMGLLSVTFIYGSVENIAGWNRSEMLILFGSSLFINQLYRGFFNQNHMRFIARVADGSFDKMLLKPINIIFQLHTGTIDMSSLISSVVPLVVVVNQLYKIKEKIVAIQLILYFILVINGLIILASFMLLLYTLAFRFINIGGVGNIYFSMMSMTEKPSDMIHNKGLFFTFMFFIPVIPIANGPTAILLGKSESWESILFIGVGFLFIFLSTYAMKKGLRIYSSASN